MEKTEKCYHYFIGLSILLGILFVVISLRFNSGYLSQYDLLNTLLIFKYSLIIVLVLSISITITLKSILTDLEWTLAQLKVDTERLKDKMKEFEKD